MNTPGSWLDEGFHSLAQPIMALRIAIEIGFPEEKLPTEMLTTRSECFQLLDRLAGDLAVMREIWHLENARELMVHNGGELLESCVAEMAAVAMAKGISIDLDADSVAMECDADMFCRAVFLLLDEAIASNPHENRISLKLHDDPRGACFDAYPVPQRGLRWQLCWEIMKSAGGVLVGNTKSQASVLFRKHPLGQSSKIL
jgi:signal transduction histidine kinase